MSSTGTTSASARTYPAAAVEACLRNEFLDVVKGEAALKGIALPTAAGAIVKASVHLDSLVTVDILCSVEPILGFELPEHVVRTGGYASIEAALGHLMPRIQAQWNKKHGVKV